MYPFEPKNIPLPHLETEDYLLTNLIWYSPETGVRTKTNGVVNDDFYLIQHSWHNWEAANQVILKALRKGWRLTKTDNVMNWLEEKGWNRYFSATIPNHEV
jgi:hypothetical protein